MKKPTLPLAQEGNKPAPVPRWHRLYANTIMAVWCWFCMIYPVYQMYKDFIDPAPAQPGCASTLAPLGADVYAGRRARLATALAEQGIGAYVVEPSANSLYYHNLSSADWHLSERPFLLVTLAAGTGANGSAPSTLVVVPSFEESRAKLQLPLALDADAGQTVWLPWAESDDPYARIAQYLSAAAGENARPIRIAVDENVRSGIAAGLQGSLAMAVDKGQAIKVISSPKAIRSLRERKTADEIDRLVCANELTLWAIRRTKRDLYIGISEKQASDLLDKYFAEAGFGKAGALVLFGPNAALPHGASDNRRLKRDDLVLIDAGGVFQGYTADITRTFAISGSKIPEEHLTIWSLVHAAQKAVYESVSLDSTGATVDEAARGLLKAAGYGQFFTHRLGHGIGLEGHEGPYLHAGQHETLEGGNTFSNEPGVYIEGRVGVRLEDCWALGEDGVARPFTPQQESVWVV